MKKICPECKREFEDNGFKTWCDECYPNHDDRPKCAKCNKAIPRTYPKKGWRYCDKCSKALGYSLF